MYGAQVEASPLPISRIRNSAIRSFTPHKIHETSRRVSAISLTLPLDPDMSNSKDTVPFKRLFTNTLTKA